MHHGLSPAPATRQLTELVWDEGHAGTVLSEDAAPIRVAGGGWSPTALVAAGLDAALMVRVLETAAEANLRVLGYVSATSVTVTGEGCPCLLLQPCVLVPAWEDVIPAHAVVAHAFATTPIIRMAGPHLRLQASVEALVDQPADEEA